MSTRGRRAASGALARGDAALRPVAPAAIAPPGGRYVSLDALRAALDDAEWAPLRLASERRQRPASPRLLHALLLHLAQQARELAGGAPSVAQTVVRPDSPRLEALLGTDRTLVAGAVEALRRAGLVLDADADGLQLAAATLGADPRCAALDWRALATATAGSPTAWVAVHALAERLDPYDWTPVPRGGLELALGCGVSGVRGALERLVSADVVARREQRGGVSVYRFTDLARGRGGEAAQPGTRPATSLPAPATTPGTHARRPPASRPAEGPHPAAGGHTETGVRLVVGGVELEIPSGCRAQVVIGADGRPTITLGAPRHDG